jgi:hypothetical protein
LLAEGTHRRQHGEFVAPKALHAPAFVVDADHERWPQRANARRQRAQLR